MTDREKLIALLNHVGQNVMQFKTGNFIESLADYLIANGVEIFSEEDEKVLEMVRQQAMEAHGDLRYLQGVKFGVESATKHGRWIDMGDFQSCSICQATRLKEVETQYGKAVWLKTPFCPDCGARMGGKKVEA